jgi:tRNA guanosine-2'-O-methyltransferase
MATNAVLALLDATTIKSAFENSLARLKAAPQGVDLDALDICVQLIPLAEQLPLDDLWDTILQRLVEEQSSTERLYRIADICLGHGPFPAARLGARIDLGFSGSEDVDNARAYLEFLKCSFWLSSEHHHLVTPDSLLLLSGFITIDELEDVAHDTLSAFFSLLRNNQKISVARPEKFGQPAGLHSLDLSRDRGLELNKSLADDSIWDKLKDLDIKRFTTKSSKIFRTWFQWISQAASDGIRFSCVEHEQYWRRLRLGLANGHADQRKYCLGIIRQSFLVTPLHINTPTMDYAASNTDREKYDLYTTLFETLVLHRYTGQVEASLPTLTTLLGSSEGQVSRITPAMATTLLAAALDPLIQESIRKMVGRWYTDFVIEVSGSS